MPGHLVKVRKKLDIHSMRRVRNVLTGNYGSVFKGRSMDFDDLREYSYGDDVKDIDWKATARSRSVMIRRYIAIRKHNILLVADNGNTMGALAPSGETKGEVATFCAGVIAYIAQHHSDLTGMVYGNRDENTRFAMKEDTAYLENFLGVRNVMLTNKVTAGTVFATPIENIHVYGLDFATLGSAGLVYETNDMGLVGVHHEGDYNYGSAETFLVRGAKFVPEVTDFIVKGSTTHLN